MIRLAGFLAGAALAVASILFIIGVPELPPAEPQHVIMPYEPQAPVATTSEPAPVAEPGPLPNPEPEAVPEPEPEAAAIGSAEAVEQPLAPLAAPSPAAADATQWFSFWSPFRSQIAANGFVRRLESVTGFDYRVVKVDAGVYEVAFAYSDDGERDQKLSTIAAATGLELPES